MPSVRSLLLALSLGLSLALPAAYAGAQLDQPAPKIDTELVGGKVLKAQELQGKVVMVVFWATWCPTCMKEMPELQRLYNAYKGKGVEMLALSLDEDAADVATYWKQNGYASPVAMRSEALKKAWGPVPATPHIVLVDRGGMVRLKHVGPIGYEQLEAKLKALL